MLSFSPALHSKRRSWPDAPSSYAPRRSQTASYTRAHLHRPRPRRQPRLQGCAVVQQQDLTRIEELRGFELDARLLRWIDVDVEKYCFFFLLLPRFTTTRQETGDEARL
jgi:hypothetical protein